MIACLIEGTRKAIFKPDLFLFRLTEAMHKYNDLVPKSQRGQTVLASRFTNQKHQTKYQKLEQGLPALFHVLLDTTFMVCNNAKEVWRTRWAEQQAAG